MAVVVFGLKNKFMNFIKKYLKKIFNNAFSAGTTNELFRVNWLKKVLKNIPANSRILDAGAGELQFKKFCSHLNYVSQDFGQYNGAGNGIGLQTKVWDNSKLDIISDITDIPRPDNSFNAIMCVEVFEHLPDPIAAIKEFSRLLKKEGTLIITAPFCSLTHFAPYHFYSGFNRYFYEKNLFDNKFEIIEITPNGNYFEYMAQELRRTFYMTQKYSNQKNKNYFLKLLICYLLFAFKKFSNKDCGSSDLLCFGYQVIARKK